MLRTIASPLVSPLMRCGGGGMLAQALRVRALSTRGPLIAPTVQRSAALSGSLLCRAVRQRSTLAVPLGEAVSESAPAAAQAATQVSTAVGVWLMGTSAAVFGMVVVGGITRLTRSGLSMTDWRPQGRSWPQDEAEWNVEFDKYKTFPEFQVPHLDMSLSMAHSNRNRNRNPNRNCNPIPNPNPNPNPKPYPDPNPDPDADRDPEPDPDPDRDPDRRSECGVPEAP